MKWEYKIIFFSVRKWTTTGLPNKLGIEFDRVGDDGWELVRTESLLTPSVLSGSFTSGVIAFFKRPKNIGDNDLR